MDLGLTGKKAIVCASSQGLGFACATALAEEGVHVWINGRTAEKLTASAEKIRQATERKLAAIAGIDFLAIHFQAKKIWPGIMPGWITRDFAGPRQRQVCICNEDPFFIR